MQPVDITKLSLDERLHLADALWESIYAEGNFRLSESHRAELDRRLALEEQGKMPYSPLNEAVERIRNS